MHFSQLSTHLASTSNSSSSQQHPPSPTCIIVKERFSKKYRHPTLDATLTKNRTKGEARSLIRCLKAGVSCPNVLGIAHWPSATSINGSTDTNTATTLSSCLVLEWIEGCTVRQYLEHRSSSTTPSTDVDEDSSSTTPNTKRHRCNNDCDDDNGDESPISPKQQDRITTPIDTQTLCVALTIGQLVGKMHAAGIIHGDLTTSNIMLKNPPWAISPSGSGDGSNKSIDGDVDDSNESSLDWRPQLALIDFGLASSTTSTTINTNNSSNTNKQQHNAEEKAVDLYVLERAFLSSHPESERLVEELLDGYRDYFVSLDGSTDVVVEKDDVEDVTMRAAASCDFGDKVDGTTATITATGTSPTARPVEGKHGHAAKMILNRLEQVMMRGRKRECFG
jgi:TP53 regulating kinase-like protein